MGGLDPDQIVGKGITVLQHKLAGIIAELSGGGSGGGAGPDGVDFGGAQSPTLHGAGYGGGDGGYTPAGGYGGASAWGGAGGVQGGTTPYGATPYGGQSW